MTKNNTYKLTPTLNNLSYKILITDASKELQIVLPCSTLPDKFKVFKQQMTNKKKKAVVIEPTDPVRICVLFVNKTNDKIDVALTSNSSESKINGQVALKPNTCQFFEFYSANGGLNWFVDALGKQDDETKVNGKLGPDIVIDANDIKISADDPSSVTIRDRLDQLSENIQTNFDVVKSDIENVQNNLDNAVKDINDNLSENVMNIIKENANNITVESFDI